jgi:teichuronic acid biosynthesis glycosyltransferase TuaC
MERLLIFSNMYPSKEHPTFGIFVKNQVELLRSNGQDVKVISIENPEKGKITTLKKYMSWFFRSFFYMAKNRKHISLTHSHYAFPTGFISLVGKKMMGIPYVVTVHGGDIDKMASIHPLIQKTTGRILNLASSVIVVGEKLKEDVIERFDVPEDRIQVMSMGVNTAIFKPAPKEEVRQELEIDTNKKVILFVGNVIKAKGLLELASAFHEVKQRIDSSVLYIIGSKKDQAFVSTLKEFIDSSDISGIHFIDPLPQKEMAKWMAAADVLALPSHHEGFGLVALEAMATGTDVVGTNVGGLSYLLNDDAGLLVKPKDVESLTQGLLEVLENSSPVIDYSVVRQKVDEHSYETILQRLLGIYEDVIKR